MKKRLLPITLLIAFIYLLIKILVFKDLAMVRIGQMHFNFGGTQEGPANIIPFKTLVYYLQGHNGLLIGGINIIGNIIALVPLGFLVPMVFPTVKWRKILMIAIASGLMIEGMQVIIHVGIFDIDDVILNGFGVLVGYWLFLIYSRFSKTTKTIASSIVLVLLCVFFLLFTLSYYKKINFPIGIEPSVQRSALPPLNNKPNENGVCCDLCNGTGGTGIIKSISENSITIRGRKGKDEIIKLTHKTIIRNSNGTIQKTGLKLEDHVTVIIDETETASLVLVCGIAQK